MRSILGYIQVAEPEYAFRFFKLALVFEILSAKIFSEKFLSTVHNTVLWIWFALWCNNCSRMEPTQKEFVVLPWHWVCKAAGGTLRGSIYFSIFFFATAWFKWWIVYRNGRDRQRWYVWYNCRMAKSGEAFYSGPIQGLSQRQLYQKRLLRSWLLVSENMAFLILRPK